MNIRKYIGTKEFYLAVIAVAIPVMAQQFVSSFVNLIDNIMIGNVGTVALSGVTVANKIYTIYNSLLFGLCGATSIFISQFFGAKDYKNTQKVLNINLTTNMIIAIVFFLILFIMPEPFVHLFSTDELVISEALKYLRIAIFSYIPYAISFPIIMSLRSIGINKIQLVVGTLGVLTNTCLNYILIFGNFNAPALGVQGAAIATIVARMLEMVIYLYVIIKRKYLFYFSLTELIHLDMSLIRHIIKKALPLTINELLYSLGLSMIFIAYVRCNESLIAAVSIVDTIVQISYIIFSGLASAVAIMIGKHLGANEIQTAKRNAKYLTVFGMFVGACVGIIFMGITPLITGLYNVEPVIKETVIILVRIRCCILPVYVFNVCAFFILRAGGDTLSTMIIDSGTLWGLSVSVATLLSVFVPMPLVLLYLTIESIEFFKMGISYTFIKKERWAKNLTKVEG